MILLRLEGGLGNQMFQYGLGRRLSIEQGVPLKFDIRSYETNPIADCSYWLESWNIDVRNNLASPEEIEHFEKYRTKKGRRWLPYNLLFADPRRYVEEKHYWFDPEVLSTTSPAMLHGWWQSEKYFAKIRNELLKDLTLRNSLSAHNADAARRMAETNSIAIQIRRKDYVSNPKTRHYHGELPFAYYRDGVAKIAEHNPDPLLVIFSDDIDWARAHMPFDHECMYVDWNGDDRVGAINMSLISKCRHQVIGNSSFGWWGAWLNTNPNKQVVAPRPWVAAMSVEETRDIVPKDWTLRDASYIRS